MAITMASTEPSTLEAAFMAQAHSTAFSWAACPGSDGLLEKARSPVGNGIPMANPSGTKSRSEEHTSEFQSLAYLVCRLLLEKKKNSYYHRIDNTYSVSIFVNAENIYDFFRVLFRRE